ncbi:chromatin protein Cren7 [Pyrodictium occultum]|uniref:Chromatin protein Cren7 n=1 Tax=Pyrodictium occultum TaxID=2309 RepID=A0A0V8RXF8_PYROC|nr:chromatin protein Cren7 [Pyrodictium occultum]
MARKKRDPYVCPKCGTRTEPVKTWQLVSPFPDSKGRVTITVMGSFVCPNCGYRWRAVVSKIKVGGSEVELESGKGAKASITGEKEERRGEVIEIDIDDIDEE